MVALHALLAFAPPPGRLDRGCFGLVWDTLSRAPPHRRPSGASASSRCCSSSGCSEPERAVRCSSRSAGGALAVAYLRSRVSGPPCRSRSSCRARRCLVRRDGSAGDRGRPPWDVTVGHVDACRPRRLRRVPGELPDPTGRLASTHSGIRASPGSPRATWYPRATTVPRVHDPGRPGGRHRTAPRVGELPTLNDHPAQPFHAARRALRPSGCGAGDPALPGALLPRGTRDVPVRSPVARLLYDAGSATSTACSPGVRVGLPPIGDRWGGFGDPATPEPAQRLLGALASSTTSTWLSRHGPPAADRFSGSCA